MGKFRIVEVISNSGHADRKGYWIVEQKKWFGWAEIYHNEGPRFKPALSRGELQCIGATTLEE